MKGNRQLLLVVYFIVMMFSFTSCKQEASSNEPYYFVLKETIKNDDIKNDIKNSSQNLQSNHISVDVVKNMVIDADMENNSLSQTTLYQTTSKKFDVEKLKKLFLDQKELEISQNEDSTILESENGALLIVRDGSVSYTSRENMWNLHDYIFQAYYQELDYGISHEKELKEIKKAQIVQDTQELLKDICNLKEDEEITLKSGVLINKDTILKKQDQNKNKKENAYEDSVAVDFFNELDKDWNPKECYYLSFVFKKDKIPLISSNEPPISKNNGNVKTELTNIEVIVDETGIQLLYVTGIFDLKEVSTTKIMSVQEAVSFLQQKYEHKTITDPCVINNIWLEYISVNNSSKEDNGAETLEPYWCFQIKETTKYQDGENISYSADRFHAVTGEDVMNQ